VREPARAAVVTGASSGIGEATARLLAARGWHCVLVARREERLRALQAEIGGEVEVCDVGDRAAVEAMAARVLARHPRVGLLVNNAGMPARETLIDADLDLIERVLEVNYLGGVWCTRALLPGLRAAARAGTDGETGAHVVNVVSVAGTVAFARSGPYVAAKHAQLGFSRTLRASLAGRGIAVHTVLPGFVETEGFPQAELRASRGSRWLVTSPGRVAGAIVDAVEKDRAEIVVPWFPYRLAGIVQGVAPGLLRRVARAGVSHDASVSEPASRRAGDAHRVAVVTGASTGIGEAAARALAARGWLCILVARRTALLERLAEEIGGEVETCDVLDREAVQALGRRVLGRHPRIGLLVSNAGALARGSFVDADLDVIEQVVRLNYLSGVWMLRSLLPGLLEAGRAGGAHVVLMASTAGVIAFEPASPYTASKHAQVASSRSLRATLAGTGVDVHALLPGFVRTEGFPQPKVFETLLGRRFVLEADDVARAVLRALDRGKAEQVLPWFPYAIGRSAQAIVPSLTARVMAALRYREDDSTDVRTHGTRRPS
jgi:short-subunit dehydrogenase